MGHYNKNNENDITYQSKLPPILIRKQGGINSHL